MRRTRRRVRRAAAVELERADAGRRGRARDAGRRSRRATADAELGAVWAARRAGERLQDAETVEVRTGARDGRPRRRHRSGRARLGPNANALDAAIVRVKSQLLFCEKATRKRRKTLEEYTWTDHEVLQVLLKRAKYDVAGARQLDDDFPVVP